MKINKIDSARFKSSEEKKFMNMLPDSNMVISSNCITPNDSWMIDYNCFSVRASCIASDRCLRQKKGFEPLFEFAYLVWRMGSKYVFKDNRRF